MGIDIDIDIPLIVPKNFQLNLGSRRLNLYSLRLVEVQFRLSHAANQQDEE
jgi:hypothetical protein